MMFEKVYLHSTKCGCPRCTDPQDTVWKQQQAELRLDFYGPDNVVSLADWKARKVSSTGDKDDV